MTDVKRTKIICTVGPATEDDEVLRDMMLAGMNVARLNFSHGTHEYHRANIERVRRIAAELGKNVAIMTDTKGPEIRTRNNEGGKPIALKAGQEISVTTKDVASTSSCVALDYENLPREVDAGNVIYIDDGLLGLEVRKVEGDEIFCTVTNGGMLGEHKGVNVPNVNVGLPSVTERDKKDIQFSCEMRVDAIAASFVRNAQAVREIRQLCREYGAPKTMIISKIESAFAVEHFDEILEVSDGIMVARGDLGIEIPPADVPHVQREIIKKCNHEYRPVITATQMLDSMTKNPRPTRAEVTDVSNAIDEGSDCVMLSGETAAGAYPVEAVKTMAEVCRKTEMYLQERHKYRDPDGVRNVSDTTGYCAVEAARHVGAKALVCPTLSGRGARIMSAFRPHLPIIATSPEESTLRRCCFYWGVDALLSQEHISVRMICTNSLRVAKKAGLVKSGDIVVITAGDSISSPLPEGTGITSDIPANIFVISEIM
ncbi:MAG: pyruvate kinase [Coriobacteriales bacterium]|nr:pyruvate kinase [Coriobacteriales bacterium]